MDPNNKEHMKKLEAWKKGINDRNDKRREEERAQTNAQNSNATAQQPAIGNNGNNNTSLNASGNSSNASSPTQDANKTPNAKKAADSSPKADNDSLDCKDNDNKKVNRQDNRQNNNTPMTLKVPDVNHHNIIRYYEWDPEENKYVYNPDKCKDNKDDDDDLTSTSDESESLMIFTSNEAVKVDIVMPHVIIDPSPVDIVMPHVIIDPSPVDDKTMENQDNKHDTNPPNIIYKSLAVSVLDDANKSNKVILNVNKKININIGYDIYRKDVAQSSDTKHSNIKNVFPASSYPTGYNTTDGRLDIKNGQTPLFRGDAEPDRKIVVGHIQY